MNETTEVEIRLRSSPSAQGSAVTPAFFEDALTAMATWYPDGVTHRKTIDVFYADGTRAEQGAPDGLRKTSITRVDVDLGAMLGRFCIANEERVALPSGDTGVVGRRFKERTSFTVGGETVRADMTRVTQAGVVTYEVEIECLKHTDEAFTNALTLAHSLASLNA